jgi:hypothetical protein
VGQSGGVWGVVSQAGAGRGCTGFYPPPAPAPAPSTTRVVCVCVRVRARARRTLRVQKRAQTASSPPSTTPISGSSQPSPSPAAPSSSSPSSMSSTASPSSAIYVYITFYNQHNTTSIHYMSSPESPSPVAAGRRRSGSDRSECISLQSLQRRDARMIACPRRPSRSCDHIVARSVNGPGPRPARSSSQEIRSRSLHLIHSRSRRTVARESPGRSPVTRMRSR